MKASKLLSADFSGAGKLSRYLKRGDCKAKSRVSPVAFRRKDPTDQLSVNSLSVQTAKQIAGDYPSEFQNGIRPTHMCVCTVAKFVEAANSQSLMMKYSSTTKNWDFGTTTPRWAFKHTPKGWSKSHCECVFTASLTDDQEFGFAGRMAVGLKWKAV